MNTIDSHSHQQFKYEYIIGTSLSNVLQRSNQISSNVDTNKEHHVLHYKENYTPPIPITEQLEKQQQQLQIIGSEFNSKISNHQLSSKHVYSSLVPKFKLSRVDQTMLQLPKRTTFLANRKTQNNMYPRTWISQGSLAVNNTTSNKLPVISSNHHQNAATQNSVNKSIMLQRTQANATLNSAITILKKTSTNNNQTLPRLFRKIQQSSNTTGRDTAPLKLPPLSKKLSSVIKSKSTDNIQDSLRFHASSSTPTNRLVLQPTPVLPIYTSNYPVTLFTQQQHLPVVKDRMIKANLTQKANFKCKSPPFFRSESSLSRSTVTVVATSQIQTKSNNPLKHMIASSLLSEADRNKLNRLFQQLDTDKDGYAKEYFLKHHYLQKKSRHLTYTQVQKCLPSNLPRAQETFFRALYDITSDITYFGLQEFYTTAVLVNMIAEQDSHIWNTLLDDVDFNYYHDDIVELLEEFDSRYSPVTSTINFDNLVALIMNRTTNGKYERITKELENLISTIKIMKFTRLEFIALIPIIIYIESCLDQGKALFRFNDNSILDLHIQKALLI
ncbi:unnamed protein product [Adineta steineri]|uniref:EF-hand domain-containing protein n=1 Tax=Adineta steineri TaxID=433720 RepID=A0A816EYW3_9BILA|nr:unnamed protein product [Adineta steineri]CAF1229559.1 unnamed protein product [Adineta steineri]CAF1546668.1 unnamed protein product [Adineta steineri]CAF1659561.1 unnamed protein product [Adineta steineri]